MSDKRKQDIQKLLNNVIKDAKEALQKAWQGIKKIDLKKIDFKKMDLRKIDFKKMDLRKVNLKKILAKTKEIDRKKIKKNFVWILLGILVVTFVLARTVGKIKHVIFKAKEAKKMVEFVETAPVKVYKVKPMDFKDTLPVMGRIEGFREIELKFDSKGIVESFNFEEGERILEGDIIASVDQKDALLKLKYAGLEVEKSKKLFDIGGIDKMALEQKKLEYESSKRDLEKTNIYAPSDGYLGSKEVDIGAFVTSQDKIGTFVDFSKVYAAFDVIEEDSPKIKIGQNAEIFLDAYPGVSYTGTVDMVSPMIEGRTRTQKTKIELDNEKNELKPGMFARAIINTYEKKDALIIPASSFKKQENKYFVYVVHPEGEEESAEDVGAASGRENGSSHGVKTETEEETEETLIEEEGVEEADIEKPEKKKAEPKKVGKAAAGKKAGKEPLNPESEESAQTQAGIVEAREIEISYLTHDVAEISKGLKEGELIIRELHKEYKDKDKVEITEVQETIF